ncbi:MAG TPA: membrane protein insertase YidC, partial [Treponemataceae bacterium]|nr:membrane protein insertase YidC [Treponemataceae bacterium]
MEKNTVWAIVLSSIVLIGFMWIQSTIYEPTVVEENQEIASSEKPEVTPTTANEQILQSTVFEAVDEGEKNVSNSREQTYTIETDVIKVTFTNKGGDVVNYELLHHKDGEKGVQMADNINAKNRAFSLSFGDAGNYIINDIFKTEVLKTSGSNTQAIRFFKTFRVKNADGTESNFVLTKIYTFKNDDYLIKLDIKIDAGDVFSGIN